MGEVVAALIGYTIGSLPAGFALTRWRGIDLRQVGSGNIGATNAYRSGGASLAMLVMAVDMAKGATSVLTARAVAEASVGSAGAIAGLAAVVGHIYPVWLRFVGGKGVAAACGAFAVLAPVATLVAAAVFVAGTWITKYVSLGSVLATITLPAIEWLMPGAVDVDLAATFAATLILFRHRGNLTRILQGTERRLGERAPVNS